MDLSVPPDSGCRVKPSAHYSFTHEYDAQAKGFIVEVRVALHRDARGRKYTSFSAWVIPC